MIKPGGQKNPGQAWLLVVKVLAMFFVTIKLGETRPPEFGLRAFSRSNRDNIIKRSRDMSGFPKPWTVLPQSPIVLTESPRTFDIQEEPTSLKNTPVIKQWMELDSVPPSHVSTKLHSEVILECVAVGSPPPTIRWLKDGKLIDMLPSYDSGELLNGVDAELGSISSGFSMAKIKSKLPIRCIRPEDEGEYKCVAVQMDGPAGIGPKEVASASVVTIDEDDKDTDWKPECEFRLPAHLYGKKARRGTPAYIHAGESIHLEVIGSTILLPCRAGGKPKPKIQWYGANNQKIIQGKKYYMNQWGDLIIRNLSWNEMGDYRCTVENPYGTETATTFVYPLLPEDR